MLPLLESDGIATWPMWLGCVFVAPFGLFFVVIAAAPESWRARFRSMTLLGGGRLVVGQYSARSPLSALSIGGRILFAITGLGMIALAILAAMHAMA